MRTWKRRSRAFTWAEAEEDRGSPDSIRLGWTPRPGSGTAPWAERTTPTIISSWPWASWPQGLWQRASSRRSSGRLLGSRHDGAAPSWKKSVAHACTVWCPGAPLRVLYAVPLYTACLSRCQPSSGRRASAPTLPVRALETARDARIPSTAPRWAETHGHRVVLCNWVLHVVSPVMA
jgi:hypothetical protein